MCLGKWHYEAAMVFRNSLLLSTLLTNAESWYSLTTKDVSELERVDEALLRKILEAPAKTPIEALYLELGATPIRFLLMLRRISYLHHILQQDEESMLFRVLKSQEENPGKGDWVHLVKQDINSLKINLTFEEIAKMSKYNLKYILKTAVKEEAYKYLSDIQSGHSKTRNLEYCSLQLQPYLSSMRSTSIKQKAVTFKLRTRMLEVADNFKTGKEDLLCKCCKKQSENQQHLLYCDALLDNDLVADLPMYEDLFSQDADKIENISNILINKYEKFKKFTPSAHNAITISSEDPSEDTDDNVRAAIGEDSNILHYYLSDGTGI